MRRDKCVHICVYVARRQSPWRQLDYKHAVERGKVSKAVSVRTHIYVDALCSAGVTVMRWNSGPVFDPLTLDSGIMFLLQIEISHYNGSNGHALYMLIVGD